jgi:hypothetical protein
MIAGHVVVRAAHYIARRRALQHFTRGDSALSAVMKANNSPRMNEAQVVFTAIGRAPSKTLLFCPM